MHELRAAMSNNINMPLKCIIHIYKYARYECPSFEDEVDNFILYFPVFKFCKNKDNN